MTDHTEPVIKITMFKSVRDRDAHPYSTTWPVIVTKATQPKEYPDKASMPLIKLACFGDVRNDTNFLRHEANMQCIHGLEGDYDAGQLDPQEAITWLGMAGITALIYTTPRHRDDAPRWRILAPLSTSHPVAERAMLLGRINGVLGGVLAAESFVPAQTYYFGKVTGVPYHSFTSNGEFVDLRPDLDAGAVLPPARSPGGAMARSEASTPDDDLRAAVLEGIDGTVYAALLSLSARLVGRGMATGDAVASLQGLLDECTWRERDPVTWRDRYDGIDRMVATASRRFGDRRHPPAREATAEVVRLAPREGAARAPPAVYGPDPDAVPLVARDPDGYLIPRSIIGARPGQVPDFMSLPVTMGGRSADVLHNSAGNAMVLVRARWGDLLWTDAATGRRMYGGRPLDETDAVQGAAYFNGFIGGHPLTWQMVMKGMESVAAGRIIDPIVDWLDGLVWDGTPRLMNMAEDVFGVTVTNEDQLERLIVRNMMIAVVARQYRPGAKYDCMPVLEGPQGAKKSSALRALFGDPYVASWDSDIQTKDFKQQLQGHLCIEVSELATFDRSHMSAVKSLLSETSDVYRAAYGRNVERRPRRCILVGTVNNDSYLTDRDGNRRFLPLKVADIDLDYIKTNREQLFAEAVVEYRAGTDWWTLPGRIVEEQADRVGIDPWQEAISEYLARPMQSSRNVFTMRDFLNDAVCVPSDRQHPGLARRIAPLLRELGLVRFKSNGPKWKRG